jgi:hypothetical protein
MVNRIRRLITPGTEVSRSSAASRRTGWADGSVRCPSLAWAATIDEPTDTAAPTLRQALSGWFGKPLA